MTVDIETLPSRVVDRHWLGWVHQGGGRYRSAFERVPPMSYQELATSDRAPLRVVVFPRLTETNYLTEALTQARTKAVGSLLAGLFEAFRIFPAEQILAGREGSWESQLMCEVAWIVGSAIAERPSRYDALTARKVTDMVRRWTAESSTEYVEVAENLIRIMNRVTERRGGWNQVADAPLRPSAVIPQRGAEAVRRLFGVLDVEYAKTAPP